MKKSEKYNHPMPPWFVMYSRKKLLPYEELDKHFTAPKKLESFFSDVKRVPRKFKKKWKRILKKDDYDFLDLEARLWFIQGLENPNYNRFLIKKTTEKYNK